MDSRLAARFGFPNSTTAKAKTFFHFSATGSVKTQTDSAPHDRSTQAEVGGDFSALSSPFSFLQPSWLPPDVTRRLREHSGPQQDSGRLFQRTFQKALLQFVPAPALPGLSNNAKLTRWSSAN